MAVAIHTVGINTADAGSWSYSNALDALGIGLSLVNFHGAPESGLVVGVSTIVGDGGALTVNQDGQWTDVRPVVTTGIGTGASFWVKREADSQFGGKVYSVNVNRPGYGYTGGEVVTLSAEDIGGSANGATDINLTLVVDAEIVGNSGYAVTFTGTSGSIVASGWDKNGYQQSAAGTANTITFVINEGDTITFRNETDDNYSNYEQMMLKSEPYNGGITTSHQYVWSYGTSYLNRNSSASWTPSWGERGEYYFSRVQNQLADVARIVVEPADGSNISTVSYGSTTDFYDSSSSPARVLKHDIDTNKKFGTSYYAFWTNNSYIYTTGWNGYMPVNSSTRYPRYYSNGSLWSSSSYTGGHGYRQNGRGSLYIDIANDYFSSSRNTILNTVGGTYDGLDYDGTMTTSYLPTSYTSYQLNLNVYHSSIDPNFAVFNWSLPTVSATSISGVTYGTFFLHNFTSNVFDLDDVSVTTVTRVDRAGSGTGTGTNSASPYFLFYTYLESHNLSKRSALCGYQGTSSSNNVVYDYYIYNLSNEDGPDTSENRFYFRPSPGQLTYADRMQTNSSTNFGDDVTGSFNAVIKGIPLSTKLLPCPYYLPDDFVFIQFEYNQYQANIQQNDTITISGSEVYKIIDGSYDQNLSGRTAGILFCARVV